MSSVSENNKRIAKNTLVLYFRMFLFMAIGLYTSRVILNTLGVEDYGIYNVVGGIVTMFSFINGSLSTSTSRSITYELGRGDLKRMRAVFGTGLTIHALLSLFIVLLAETIGLWFMYKEMQIPVERMEAAMWVFQLSVLSTVLSIMIVPYNAAIIAHERMSAFAWISLLDVSLKLIIVFLLVVIPFDKLVIYAILFFLITIVDQMIYIVYCHRHFQETNVGFDFDKGLAKEMFSLAGWTLFGNGAYMLNTQGVNMLINVFFGVVENAARGIANQVNGIVNQFVGNFMMALNPQITKYYASGDYQSAYTLACRGAKFSFLLMYFIALPIMLESDQLLTMWLGIPPQNASVYVVWTILASLTTVIGQPLITLQLAQGEMKKYQIYITFFGLYPFPLTWLGYYLGAPVIWAFQIFFIVYYCLIYIRLWLVHSKTGIPYGMYLREVIGRTHLVVALSIAFPLLVVIGIEPSFFRFLATGTVSVISVGASSLAVGLTKNERIALFNQIKKIVTR